MWDVFFSKLLGRGLIEVLPALLASIFVAYKSFHTIEEPKDEETKKEETIDGKYAAKQFRERSITKKRRILHLFLFLVILPAAFASLSVLIKGFVGYHEPGDWALLFILFFLLLCIPMFLKEPYAQNLTGHISTKSAKYLLRTTIPYHFYLRPFETDKKKDVSLFDEDVLAKSLKRKLIRFYSLGNPREIDSPTGSTRVYSVNDWVSDVDRIIHRRKTRHVYFRVGTSDGCTIEFKLLQDILEKTTLIIDKDGLSHYEKLREEYTYLPDLEPITGDYLYFLHSDVKGDWVIERCVSNGVEYLPYSAKKQHGINPETVGYFRDRLLKIFGAIVMLCIISFIMSNSKEKRAKEAWIEAIITTFPIAVDSILTIQSCDFPLSGLNIEVTVSDSAKQPVSEEQAVLCFFHLNQYDLGKVRTCYKIIADWDGDLRIMIKGANDLQPTIFAYHNVEEFEGLWSICKQIEQQRIDQQKKVEASAPNARVKRIRDSFKEIRSGNFAY